MKFDITRNVISDLWPLYAAQEASADSKRMVEEFLAEDRDFRSVLEESERIQKIMPEVTLSPDAELQLIATARERIRMKVWLWGAAIAVFGFVSLAWLAGALFYALRNS
jgi:hypothetical protein